MSFIARNFLVGIMCFLVTSFRERGMRYICFSWLVLLAAAWVLPVRGQTLFKSAGAGTPLTVPGAVPVKDKKVVGFAQTGSESGWRNANTVSVKEEAAKRGYDLRFVDAQGRVENQLKAVYDFIAAKVDIIVVEPL